MKALLSQPSRRPDTRSLQSLPSVFAWSDLRRRLGWEKDDARTALHLWLEYDLVRPLMSRRLSYLNMLSAPTGATSAQERATLLEFPSAVVRGHQALADAGLCAHAGLGLDLALSEEDHHLASTRSREIRGIKHTTRWRRILNAAGAIQIPASPDKVIPRMTGGAALAELMVMHTESCPPADAINFSALDTRQEMLFRRMTGLLTAGPLIPAYAHLLRRLQLQAQRRAEILANTRTDWNL